MAASKTLSPEQRIERARLAGEASNSVHSLASRIARRAPQLSPEQIERLRDILAPHLFPPQSEYVAVTRGLYDMYVHECGNDEWWPTGEVPTDGSCDACESGSSNPDDWQRVYVKRVDGGRWQ